MWWPKHHPIFLSQQAEKNTAEAVVQLGNYSYSSLDFNKAKYWFKKAVNAGNEDAIDRLQALEASVTSFEKEEKLNETK